MLQGKLETIQFVLSNKHSLTQVDNTSAGKQDAAKADNRHRTASERRFYPCARLLPGDLQQKLNPYLRPIYDALRDMIEADDLARMEEAGIIEIAPLAYMRGRTLSNAFVILDEGQNTTASQMKMFLTRLGHESKMIITGDPSQTDLNNPAHSGLVDAARRFREVPGVSFIRLQNSDVVRHPLVQRVIEAYQSDGPHH